jgi:hypothetical protein
MHIDGNQNAGPEAPTALVEAIEQQFAAAIAQVRRHAAFMHAMIARHEGLSGPGGMPGS